MDACIFLFIPEFKRPYYFNGRRRARQHRGNCDRLLYCASQKKYFHCMLENLTRINNGNIFGRPAPRSS